MNKKNGIYGLKLHESSFIGDDVRILRVAGGWIYYENFTENGSSIFVPFSDEFEGFNNLEK